MDVPYLDDRSGAEALITSFSNAINRKEYARAYGYWKSGAAELPPYGAFEQGYSSTSAVQVGFGTITGDVGAGQSRYSVPVRITFRSRRALALLICLAVENRFHTGDQLAVLLWPDAEQTYSRMLLRRAIALLRNGLAAVGFDSEHVVVLEQDRLRLNRCAPHGRPHRETLALCRAYDWADPVIMTRR